MRLLRIKLEMKMNGQQMSNKISREWQRNGEATFCRPFKFLKKRRFFILIYFFSHHTQLHLCHDTCDEEQPALTAVGIYCCSSLPSRFILALRVIRSPSRVYLNEVLSWAANLLAHLLAVCKDPPWHLVMLRFHSSVWDTWKMQTPEPLRLCCETFHHFPPLLYYSYATCKQMCRENFQSNPYHCEKPHNKIYC